MHSKVLKRYYFIIYKDQSWTSPDWSSPVLVTLRSQRTEDWDQDWTTRGPPISPVLGQDCATLASLRSIEFHFQPIIYYMSHLHIKCNIGIVQYKYKHVFVASCNLHVEQNMARNVERSVIYALIVISV